MTSEEKAHQFGTRDTDCSSSDVETEGDNDKKFVCVPRLG